MKTADILYMLFITAIVLIAFYTILFILKKWAGTKKRFFPALVQKHLHGPGLFLCMIIIMDLCMTRLRMYLKPGYLLVIDHLFKIITIVMIGFFIIKVVKVIYEILIHYYSSRNSIDYSLRRAKTKLQMLQRILNLLIFMSVVIAVLMTFSEIRKFGNTLLASAGVAGIILGFAAQKSLGTLFSGIQIALAQPVKLDDVVVVDGQFGNVGEITLTYIVVNTWDEKRLIVPINYFLENSFENWTRVSPEVVGIVKIYADYSLPVDELREQFKTWLSETSQWDKRKAALLVTDSTETTIELRATMSAENSDDAFDLECLMREKLISYIRTNYSQSLPHQRVHYMDSEMLQKKPEIL